MKFWKMKHLLLRLVYSAIIITFLLLIIWWPAIDTIINSYVPLDSDSELDMVVEQYYYSRNLGYVNKSLILPNLHSSPNGPSLLSVVKKGAGIQKPSTSDTIWVTVDSEKFMYICKPSEYD